MHNFKKLSLVSVLCLCTLTVLGQDALNGCTKKIDLYRALDKLWLDHVYWTRLYLLSAIQDLPDKKPTLDRLLQNQKDLGNAIVPFYGKKNGNKLAELLKEHILISDEVVKAAASNNKAALKTADDKWHANADQISEFLSTANPDNWPFKEMQKMMYEHLKLTTEEAVAIIKKDWTGNIKKFDEVEKQILSMSKGIADGIVQQFPDKFALTQKKLFKKAKESAR